VRLGLLSEVISGGREEVVKAAIELAGVIAGKSPVSVSGTKRILMHSREEEVECAADGHLNDHMIDGLIDLSAVSLTSLLLR
jgi:enoyl-CoA hydratase/carnithine racemase